jgi:hypothetical protein
MPAFVRAGGKGVEGGSGCCHDRTLSAKEKEVQGGFYIFQKNTGTLFDVCLLVRQMDKKPGE